MRAIHRSSSPRSWHLEDLGAHANDMLAHLCALGSRRYWKRLWIVPELILGKSVLLYCGNRTVHLDDLCTTMKFTKQSVLWKLDLNRDQDLLVDLSLKLNKIGVTRQRLLPPPAVPEHWQLVDEFTRLQSFRQNLFHLYAGPLSALLHAFHTRDCLLSRDRIYALMGIAVQEDEPSPMEVDYTSSTAAVLFRALRYLGSGHSVAHLVHTSLDFDPQTYLDGILLERDRQGEQSIYREPVLSVPFRQCATIVSYRSTHAFDVEECVPAPSPRRLAASRPVTVGDTVFATVGLGSGVVVVCRGNLHDAGFPEDNIVPADHEVAIAAIGFLVKRDKSDALQISPRWYDYHMDGMVFRKRAWNGYTYTMMLSAVDIAVLQTQPLIK